MNRFFAILSLFLGFGISSCKTNPIRPTPTYITTGQYSSGFDYEDPTSKEYFRRVYDLNPNIHNRNKIVHELTAWIDNQYFEYESNLRVALSGKNTAISWATIAMNATAATTGSIGVKEALSVASAGLVGANAAFDSNFLRDQTVQALQIQMRVQRKTIAAKITSALKGHNNDTYPLEAALVDLVEYYHAGSITSALQNIVITASAKEEAAETKKTAEEEKPDSPEVKAEKNSTDPTVIPAAIDTGIPSPEPFTTQPGSGR